MMEQTLTLIDGSTIDWEWYDYGRDIELKVFDNEGTARATLMLNTEERRKLIAALSYCLP